MNFVTPEIEIPDNNPFQYDLLSREGLADGLSQIILNHKSQHLVAMVSGTWGSGKSTFVKMLRRKLATKHGNPVLYIDAFAEDHSDDAFSAIFAAISTFAKEAEIPVTAVASLREKAAKFALTSIPLGTKAAMRIALKAITLGVVDEELSKEFSDQLNALNDDISETLGDTTETVIEGHLQAKATLDSLRTSLEELVRDLDDRGPMVVIIDELDRCRPDFALRILEKIKHVFSIPNIVFVLVAHRDQLEKSICSAYGDIDAKTYLEKFIHLECNLLDSAPLDVKDVPTQPRKAFVENLIQPYSETLSHFNEQRGWFANSITEFGCYFQLSLRETERLTQNVILYEMAIPERTFNHPPLVTLVAYCRLKHPHLFSTLRTGQTSVNEIRNLVDRQTHADELPETLKDAIDMCVVALDSDRMLGVAQIDSNSDEHFLVQRFLTVTSRFNFREHVGAVRSIANTMGSFKVA